jgi:hypothetical protein
MQGVLAVVKGSVMKLILQCDTASCSASEAVEIHLSKKQEEKISSFIKEHGQLHTVIST